MDDTAIINLLLYNLLPQLSNQSSIFLDHLSCDTHLSYLHHYLARFLPAYFQFKFETPKRCYSA